MRQLCNVSFVMQAEGFSDETEFEKWLAGLNVAPGERPRLRSNVEDTGILDLMGGGGVGAV